MRKLNRMAVLLADIAAHPDAAPFAMPRSFGLIMTDDIVHDVETQALRQKFVKPAGVRFDTLKVHKVCRGDKVLDEQDEVVSKERWIVRRRRALYTLTAKGKQWLSSHQDDIIPRRKETAQVPVFSRSAVAIATSPRDVFDLCDMPWRCKMPDVDLEQKRRVTRFLTKHKAARLSAAGDEQQSKVEWIALDWKSPTAGSLRLESAPSEPSTDAGNATTV